jgi:hypothetical protein
VTDILPVYREKCLCPGISMPINRPYCLRLFGSESRRHRTVIRCQGDKRSCGRPLFSRSGIGARSALAMAAHASQRGPVPGSSWEQSLRSR